MKKIFTFLVAFLTTVSGAVWGQERGTRENPLDIGGRTTPLEINDDEDWFITTSSQNTGGIKVLNGKLHTDGKNPTIYLMGVDIKAGGSAIEIEYYSKPTLVILGENTIHSTGTDAAIKIPTDIAPGADLTISEESTGILNIIMDGNEDSFSNKIAIGNTIEGNSSDIYDCGTLSVNGGTIKTNGRIGRFNQHSFTFSGNAIVIANDIVGFDYNDEDMRKGGLLFLNDDTPYVGEFHTPEQDPEFTLSSPLPEPYQIELRTDGVKLEIGPDQTLNESQLVDDGGQVKGYKVTYSSSKIDGVTTAELPTTKFVGSNYKVEAWDDQAKNSDPSTTYERIDQWMLNENGSSWISAGSAVGALGDYTTLSNIPTKNYQAVWYLKEKSITINLTGATGGFDGSFALWYPDQPEMLFTATEQTPALADAGLKLSDDDRTVSGLDELGSVTEGEHTAVLKLNATAGDNKPAELTTTLKVNVIIKEYTADEVTATATTEGGSSLTYNGKLRKNDITVKVASTDGITIGSKFYSVVFKKQNAEGTYDDNELDNISDAGTYQVIVKANAEVENQVLAEDFEKEAGTVTISQATLTVKEKTPAEWTIGDEKLSKAPTFTLETICSDENGDLDEVEIDTYDTNEFASTPTTPGEYDITYSNFKLKGADAANYTVDGSSTVAGKVKVSKEGTTEDPIDDDGDDPLITGAGDWDNGTRTYDGKPHPLTAIEVKNGTETERVSISLTDVEITYSYKQTEEAQETTPKAVQNAGTYTATFTFPENEYGYKGIGKVSLTIDPATLTATTTDAMPQIGVGESLEDINISSKDATQYIKFKGLQNGEKAAYTGTLKANKDLDTSAEGELENAYTVDVTLAPEGTFDPNNYTTPSYDDIKVSAVVGKITINPGGDGEEGDDVTGGEDENNDGELDYILIRPDGEGQCSVYDGEPHGLDVLYVGEEKYRLDKGTDYTVSYEGFGADEEPVNAGEYRATITLSGDSKYQLEGDEQSFDLTIHIVKRWVTVDFGNFPASIDIDTETLDASLYAIWQKEGEVANKGLIDGEEPIYEGTLVLTPSEEYPEYFNVYLDRETFKVEDNDPFFVNNYEINIYDEEGEKWITLEENEEGDATLPDGEDDPLVDTPDEEGGIEIEDGSSTSGGGYYQDWNDLIIYESEGATLKSRYDRMRVKDGGKFTLSLTIDEAYAGAEPVVYYRRGRGGDWTPLKISINGLYHVDNVYTDIYVKVMGDGIWVVGNEDITATDARAYAQPNKIVVITPQPTDVQIISMAGAVVATDKVTGQREFANLTEGVYIVRMGETVVKLQVRK